VLTTRNASAVGTDNALLKEIPTEVRIHRTVALDLPFGIKKRIKKLITGRDSSKGTEAAATAGKTSFLKKVLQDLLLPDPQVTWLPVLTRAGSPRLACLLLFAAAAAAAAGMIGMALCGGGYASSTSSAQSTPAGTYSIPITFTSGGTTVPLNPLITIQ
jgi:hypothetical protein